MFNDSEFCSHCKYINYAGGTWVCCRQLEEDIREEHPELGEPVKISDKACYFFIDKKELEECDL